MAAKRSNTMRYPIWRLAALLLCAGIPFFASSQPKPDAVTVDSGRYFGPLVNGKMHGRGRMEWANGLTYEGEFKDGLLSGRGQYRFGNGNTYKGEFADGMMSGTGRFEVPGREVYEGELKEDFYWGKGRLTISDGRVYAGDFVHSMFDGRGRLEMANGEVYEGEFRKNEFTGNGSHSRKDGSRYDGEFQNWQYHGPGRYADGQGGVWEGTFANGQLEGRGKYTATGDLSYEGDFKAWLYEGRGILRLRNGDVYEGDFARGVYEGEGTLTYAKPRADGRTREKGTWRYGYLPNEAEMARTLSNVEAALYTQRPLLDGMLGALKPRQAGRINMYLLAVGGGGSEEVFRREVQYVGQDFASRFGTAGRAVLLFNSRNTADSAPMATLTSIREALKAIAARMDREQDILFLFLTSHGSREHELTLSMRGMQLQGLRAAQLRELVKASGIKWKVVVVSACYSGGFMDALRDDHTLVMTAARHDRRSFGCADENDFTYFGRAFFKEALPASKSFEEAFRKAATLVTEWELKDVSAAAAEPGRKDEKVEDARSLPQISSAEPIEAHLRRWWAQMR
jgi:hypothetical protein